MVPSDREPTGVVGGSEGGWLVAVAGAGDGPLDVS